MLTKEQMEDRASVWRAMEERHPEFLPWMDPLNNYHAVREIVLGGSVGWAGVHERFKPEEGKLVMDVGANAGIFSAFCGANGAGVVAYEPFPRPFAILSGMVITSKLLNRVIPMQKAVWTYTGITKYFGNVTTLDSACPAFNGGVRVDGVRWTQDYEDNALDVHCISFDGAIGSASWDMVKMDVEGAEFEILLATPEDALRRIKFMYLEFHPWPSRELYERTCDKLQKIFHFEGSVMRPDGRWEAAYLTRKD